MPNAKKPHNQTALHLERRLKETGGVGGGFWRQIQNAIKKFLPVSASSDQAEDHIQEFFRRVIDLDAFAKRLNEGYEITDNDIVVFAIRSGYSDIRKWGTNPVTRTLYGARTEREREKQPKEEQSTRAKFSRKSKFKKSSEEKTLFQQPWDDLVDEESTMTAQAIESQIQFDQMWAKIEKMLAKRPGRYRKHYLSVARKRFLEGYTVEEIARSENLPPVINLGLVRDVRSMIQSAPLWKNL